MNIIEQMYKYYKVEKQKEYPAFTTEKQIELFEFIKNTGIVEELNFGLTIHFGTTKLLSNKPYSITVILIEELFDKYDRPMYGEGNTTQEAIANLLIDLIECIDNSKVKEILEK